jgi:hypothetical protein
MSLKKIQIFALNPLILANGITEHRQCAAKTNQNSIFLIRDTHIPDR